MISSNAALTVAKYALGASVTATILAIGGLWYFQRSLIYPSGFPEGSRIVVPKPIEVGCPYEDVTLTCSDGVKIKAYVIMARRKPLMVSELRGLSLAERKERAQMEMEAWAQEMSDEKAIEYSKSRPTIVIFHANAGNMGHRVPLARHFNVDFRCNVFMLSYRGYGHSEGKPSESGKLLSCCIMQKINDIKHCHHIYLGLQIDIQTAMKYVQAHPILGQTKIILYGQSLGGAACFYATSKHRDAVAGVIVENTMLSFKTLVPLIMPQIPRFLLPILLTEHWDAHKTVPLIPSTTPILFLVGKRDTLVKAEQMLALRKLRGSGRTRWREFDGEHNDTCLQPGYWEEIGKWLREEIEDDVVEVVDQNDRGEKNSLKATTEDATL
ncbi:BEM46 family protein [Cryptococcus neoformans Tu401-1]|nr:BEM46 family protein [Cryptococcus neoformans var. grubii Tu401-1]